MQETYSCLGIRSSLGIINTADILATSTTDYAVISTVSICNRAATSATYRVCVSTVDTFEDNGYLVYDATVPTNDTIFLTLGITIDAINSYLLCSASATTVSFTVYGKQYSSSGGGAT